MLDLEDCTFGGDSSGSDSSAAGDSAEWAAEAEAVCARATEANAELFAEFNENPVDSALDMQVFLGSILTGLESIEADTGADGEELLSAMEGFVAAAGALSDAVSSGDTDTFVAAYQEFSAAGGPVNAAADVLEAPNCGGY